MQLANDTDYGLAAGLDHRRAPGDAGVAEARGRQGLRQLVRAPLHMPFGGYKDSGYGREKGIEALNDYTRSKASLCTGCCRDRGFHRGRGRAGGGGPVRRPAGRGGLSAPWQLRRWNWLGVTIAGSAEPSAFIAQRVAAGEGGYPLATVVGTGLRTGPQQAALANGVAAHALDDLTYGNRWACAYPSALVVSAVLALAESRGASGAQAAEAVVAGIQVLRLIGYAKPA